MTRRILIAGGLGYVGGRVAQALVDQPGVKLRLGLRHPPASPPAWFSRVESVPLDLLAGDTLEAACRGMQEVINLAAMNEIHSAADPGQALQVNGAGALKLLQAAQAAGVVRFIQFSTAHVYGTPLAGRITEKSLTRPVHPYAITHRVAEDFVLAARDRGLIGDWSSVCPTASALRPTPESIAGPWWSTTCAGRRSSPANSSSAPPVSNGGILLP